MSIVPRQNPAVIHATTNISKWNAAYNECAYIFRRQDYSVLYGIAASGSMARLVFLTAQTYDLSVGDSMYLSSIDDVVTVTQIINAGTFRHVYIDRLATAQNTQSGYANNVTARKNHVVEFNIHVFNNETSQNEIAGTVRLAGNKQGIIKLVVNPFVESYLNNRNESTYLQQTYNDLNAWAKFYFSSRQIWKGYTDEALYEDRTLPYLGPNLITNSHFDLGSDSWELDNMVWYSDGTVGKDMSTTASSTTAARMYPAPALLTNYPTIAGRTYRMFFNIVSSVGANSSVNTVKARLGLGTSDAFTVWNYCGLAGRYDFDFVAPFNNSHPSFTIDENFSAIIDDVELREVINDVTTNPPRYYYMNKGARQLQQPYGANQAEHVVFYDTIATAANRAKFISDFVQPTWFSGYPFDIAILFDESLQGVDIKRKELISTGVSEYLLNKALAGEHRIKLTGGYATSIKELDVWLEVGDVTGDLDEYVDEDYVDTDYVETTSVSPATETGEVTERRRIRINHSCFTNHVYLSWKGSAGGWNYYLFTRNQTHSVEIKGQEIVYPYVPDLNVIENQFLLSNESQPSITLGASNLDRNDLIGISRMLESSAVRLYNSTDGTWQTVIVKQGTFKLYEVKDSRHDIEFTILLPFRYTHNA
jgi:hypothetical protein